MANEQIQRWSTKLDFTHEYTMFADEQGVYVFYDDHLAATTDLREGQMHLAMELERKDEQIRKLREALELCDIESQVANGHIGTPAYEKIRASLKAGE